MSEETKKERFVEILREKINNDDILKEINIENTLKAVDKMTLGDLYLIDDNTLAYVKKTTKISFFYAFFIYFFFTLQFLCVCVCVCVCVILLFCYLFLREFAHYLFFYICL